MAHYADSLDNRKRLQAALNAAGANPPLIVDGVLGALTADAIRAYRARIGLGAGAVIDNKLLSSLNLTETIMDNNIVGGVIATGWDYLLNAASSKIVWAAGAMVAIIVGWISTKFGINIPPDQQQWVTGILVTAFGALIAWLRTFKNNPKVISGGTVVK